MSYSIQYGPVMPPKAKRKQRINIPLLVSSVFVPTLILAAWTHPKETHEIKSVLFPWEQEYVQEAFSDFSNSVRSGEKFKDAVTALYMQILDAEDHAQ